jgi:general secretion pathway protein G
MKKSFTMLELIFVIVVIGILAGVAIPRLFTGVSDAEIAKVKSDVSAVRSAISTHYGKSIMSGRDECPKLENSTTDNQLFEGILTYSIKKNNGAVKWDGNGTDYNVTLGDKTVIKFEYNNSTDSGCKFECKGNCSVIGE